MRAPGRVAAHLTYCTNIHPGETWAEVRRNLERHVLRVRQLVAPDRRFGVGLRLSARAARELSAPAALAELRDFLDAHALYVFTLNGFPYGAFSGTRVKEAVYRPDWLEEDRLAYSDLLADLLAALMPDDADLYGSVSTVPLGDRARVCDEAAWQAATDRLLRHAVHLASLRERTGKTIVAALEPEPGCALETSADAAAFFTTRLHAPAAAARVRAALGCSESAAAEVIGRHLGVCLDACHAAVEFETPKRAVETLQAAGVFLAKLQISAGLRIAQPDAAAAARLEAFADDVYLHQVVARRGPDLRRYLDLPELLAHARDPGRAADDEWRVHFHVPLFRERLEPFESTSGFAAELLAIQHATPVCAHLEVETYTWDVLPPEHRGADVDEDVAREMEWVLRHLQR